MLVSLYLSIPGNGFKIYNGFTSLFLCYIVAFYEYADYGCNQHVMCIYLLVYAYQKKKKKRAAYSPANPVINVEFIFTGVYRRLQELTGTTKKLLGRQEKVLNFFFGGEEGFRMEMYTGL